MPHHRPELAVGAQPAQHSPAAHPSTATAWLVITPRVRGVSEAFRANNFRGWLHAHFQRWVSRSNAAISNHMHAMHAKAILSKGRFTAIQGSNGATSSMPPKFERHTSTPPNRDKAFLHRLPCAVHKRMCPHDVGSWIDHLSVVRGAVPSPCCPALHCPGLVLEHHLPKPRVQHAMLHDKDMALIFGSPLKQSVVVGPCT